MARRVLTYKDAGVDIGAKAAWVERIRHVLGGTYGPRVCSRHGAFAGLFRLDFREPLLRRNYRQPMLVGCADGVGSKVLLAVEMDDLSTIGIDLVAMNVNDLITCGAEPLFFLDYLAVNRLDSDRLMAVMEGMAAGCREARCALLGGETAELPDLYQRGHLDLAGFAVGVVEARRLVDPGRVQPDDLLIGLPSSGVHCNGYTLVRKILGRDRWRLDEPRAELGESLGAALLRPTRIYVRAVEAVLRGYRTKRVVNGMAHITGGGLVDNVVRAIGAECDAVINCSSWVTPAIFRFLQRRGVAAKEMYRVFNMGIGYVLVVRPTFAAAVCRRLERVGEQPVVIGEVRRGSGRVTLV